MNTTGLAPVENGGIKVWESLSVPPSTNRPEKGPSNLAQLEAVDHPQVEQQEERDPSLKKSRLLFQISYKARARRVKAYSVSQV